MSDAAPAPKGKRKFVEEEAEEAVAAPKRAEVGGDDDEPLDADAMERLLAEADKADVRGCGTRV